MLFYELTVGHINIKTLLCPLRAAMDAGVMERPSYNDFVAVFGCEDILTKKMYSDYTKPQYKGFLKMQLYKNSKIEFLRVKTMKL